jgi:hypothetical protein
MSRRAHADRISFRLHKEEGDKIIDGKYIWTEYRCPNVVSEGKVTCIECTVKLPKYKYQATPKCDHGLVGGPYPSDSKLYGSPFYLTQVKAGWKIGEADERRAKEAQLIANSNMGRKKADTAVTAPAISGTVTTPEPVKPKQPRKPRAVKAPETILVQPAIQAAETAIASGPAKFTEAMTLPIKIIEVITVKVKKTRIEGKDYYFDSISGKVYGISTNGVGPYKGRYNPETEVYDTKYPDSDEE